MKTQFWKKCFEQVWSKKLQKSKKKPKSPIFLRFSNAIIGPYWHWGSLDKGQTTVSVDTCQCSLRVNKRNLSWCQCVQQCYNGDQLKTCDLFPCTHIKLMMRRASCLKRRKMHVILCRVVLYIKRKNLFTVCNWCLLSACVSNLCVSCETLHCLAQALSGFCTWMWYIWNTQFVLYFFFHNQKYWIVLQMLQSGCCTWMWCMWNTHCVSKIQLCRSSLSIF